MFEFRRCELLHWDFLKRTSLPFDAQLVTVIGRNGSGKTTLLDALRTLLAIDCSKGRDFKGYVRRNDKSVAWIRAVVTNPRTPQGKLSFYPIQDADVTLACRIRRKSGDWKREFIILPGDVSIEDIGAHHEDKWYGKEQYQRNLEKAGLSKAISKVLALEQGATNKLCKLSPRDMLRLVFDAHGDQEVLDAYQNAKNEQLSIQKELEGLKQDLDALEVQVEKNQLHIDSYNEWKRLTEQLAQLKYEDIPRLQLMEWHSKADGIADNLIGQRRQLREYRTELQERSSLLKEMRESFAQAEGALKELNGEVDKKTRDCERLTGERKRLESLLDEELRLKALCQKLDSGFDAQQVSSTLEEDREKRAEIHNRIKTINRDLKHVQGALTAIKKTRKSELHPAQRNMRDKLNAAGIDHVFLCEVTEVVLPDWQAVLEGLIGGEAHTVLLSNPADNQKAWEIGEALRYRSRATSDCRPVPKAERGSLLETVEFSQNIPQLIIQRLNRIQRVETVAEGVALPSSPAWVTRPGYLVEAGQGGRYVAAGSKGDYRFGQAAIDAQIESYEQQIQELDKELQGCNETERRLTAAITDAERLLSGWDADENLKARLHEFTQARDALKQVKELQTSAVQEQKEAVSQRDKKQGEAQSYKGSCAKLENKIENIESDQKKLQTGYERLRREHVDLVLQYRKQRAQFAYSERTEAVMQHIHDKYQSIAKAESTAKLLEEKLSEETFTTDPDVVLIGKKLRKDFEEKQGVISSRREHHVRALSLTEKARNEYMNVLRATLQIYSKNLKVLGEMSGVNVQVSLPKLENDDVVLASAGLNIEFRFDQKMDADTSGGQEVIQSLILLVALMMEKDAPGGFVFIDEPYAHLDLLNINLVNSFLRSSGAQYVLTTPLTHNINSLEVSDLSLITHTWQKDSGDVWAPPITWMRKKQDAA